MSNSPSPMTTRLHRDLSTTKHVVEIITIQAFKAMKHHDGSFHGNGYTLTLHDDAKSVIQSDAVCKGCSTKATHVAIIRKSNSPSLASVHKPKFFMIPSPSDEPIELVMDHVVPLALGGSDSIANSQCLCAPCHDKKVSLLSGLNINKLVEDKLNNELDRFGKSLVLEFKKAPLLLKLVGLSRFANKLLSKVYKHHPLLNVPDSQE